MRSAKTIIMIVMALLPIAYCGGLAFHFLDFAGGMQGAQDIGLGPTVIGLGVVGLLFCIPLIFRITQLFNRPRTPGSGPGRGPSPRDDNDGFDADAVVAKYLAQRTEEPPARTSSRPSGYNGAAKPTGFGRRIQ